MSPFWFHSGVLFWWWFYRVDVKGSTRVAHVRAAGKYLLLEPHTGITDPP